MNSANIENGAIIPTNSIESGREKERERERNLE